MTVTPSFSLFNLYPSSIYTIFSHDCTPSPESRNATGICDLWLDSPASRWIRWTPLFDRDVMQRPGVPCTFPTLQGSPVRICQLFNPCGYPRRQSVRRSQELSKGRSTSIWNKQPSVTYDQDNSKRGQYFPPSAKDFASQHSILLAPEPIGP